MPKIKSVGNTSLAKLQDLWQTSQSGSEGLSDKQASTKFGQEGNRTKNQPDHLCGVSASAALQFQSVDCAGIPLWPCLLHQLCLCFKITKELFKCENSHDKQKLLVSNWICHKTFSNNLKTIVWFWRTRSMLTLGSANKNVNIIPAALYDLYL